MSDTKTPRPDPLYTKSFSWPMAIGIFLLLVSTLWAFYDEFFARRPYKALQDDFVELYTKRLKAYKSEQAAKEKSIRESDEFVEFEPKLKDRPKLLVWTDESQKNS